MTQESSEKLEQPLPEGWLSWQRMVVSRDYQLFQQVLKEFRLELVDRLVRVDSQGRPDVVRGAIQMLDFILTGKIDAAVRDLLGLSSGPDLPPAQGYMAEEEN